MNNQQNSTSDLSFTPTSIVPVLDALKPILTHYGLKPETTAYAARLNAAMCEWLRAGGQRWALIAKLELLASGKAWGVTSAERNTRAAHAALSVARLAADAAGHNLEHLREVALAGMDESDNFGAACWSVAYLAIVEHESGEWEEMNYSSALVSAAASIADLVCVLLKNTDPLEQFIAELNSTGAPIPHALTVRVAETLEDGWLNLPTATIARSLALHDVMCGWLDAGASGEQIIDVIKAQVEAGADEATTSELARPLTALRWILRARSQAEIDALDLLGDVCGCIDGCAANPRVELAWRLAHRALQFARAPYEPRTQYRPKQELFGLARDALEALCPDGEPETFGALVELFCAPLSSSALAAE